MGVADEEARLGKEDVWWSGNNVSVSICRGDRLKTSTDKERSER